jgi:outer membrane protein assembly factor BamB
MGVVLLLLSTLIAPAAAEATGSGNPVAAAAGSVSRPSVTARPSTPTASDWTTFDQNPLRTGVDASGSSFTTATAAWTTPDLDGQLYGQPLVDAGRVFVATENDTVYALAADNGAVLWSHHLATPVPAGDLPCGDISPTVGITGSPVIDPARSEIFVVADEETGSGPAHHLIGLDLYTGAVLLDQDIDPAGTDPAAQLQRVSLALDQGSVIAGFGGNSGDCSTYHGLLVSTPEGGGTPTTFVVADQPGDSQGAVWMGGAAPTVDAEGHVWVATGNSAFHSSGDTYDDSDGVLELSPSLHLLDSFAPLDWYADNASDLDLGSTTPAVLSNGLVFEVGKSQTAYVLRQSHLGGVGGQIQLKANFCFADGGSADLNGTLFVPCSNGVESVTPSASSPPAANWATASGAHGSPIVTGGMVWSIGNGNLYALNLSNGQTVHTLPIGASASSFPSPSAADGLVLAPSSTQVHAFEGPAGLPGPPPTITSFSPTSGPVGTVVTIKGTHLAGATKVTFDGPHGTITKDTASTIKVTVPAQAQTGWVKVATPGGKVETAKAFTVT